MAHILLFHHALGLTEGIKAFADELRSAGHTVTSPDLYDGRTFSTVEEGLAHAKGIGFDSLVEAGVGTAAELLEELVYAGFSLGVMPAQRLAQQRPGARGALLYHSVIPIDEFGDAWPEGVPLQAHLMRNDPFEEAAFIEDIVRQADGQLYLYEGDAHLFTDASLAEYNAGAAALVMRRTLEFLDAIP